MRCLIGFDIEFMRADSNLIQTLISQARGGTLEVAAHENKRNVFCDFEVDENICLFH